MRYLLDTNTISYLLNHRSQEVRVHMQKLPSTAHVLLSSLCEAEILSGLQKRQAGRLLEQFRAFAATLHRVSWDSQAAESYADLDSYLSRRGLALSLMDKLIASHALSSSAVLVTHDKALHRTAPFLALEDWSRDVK